MTDKVTVIGAGLAGCEAAWQLAKAGVKVELMEMKPEKLSPAHHDRANFAELVCSNSLRSAELTNAVGLLKEEMRRLGSVIMECADATKVEAGGALAVDRTGFSSMITEKIKASPFIEIKSGEVTQIPEGRVIIATGPLTSDALSEKIGELIGNSFLNFFDAAAPLVSAESIDMDSAFFASRYDKGSADYINCPMTQEEYTAFWKELVNAKQAEIHGFEDSGVFEGCMPVEVMARRGVDTLRYGPLKPVGLKDPKTGKEAYAVVQLRKDNAAASVYNLVGFQTHLTFGEQKRVFSMIPALKKAEFLRYGVMHRNTYIASPGKLDNRYRLIEQPRVSFAGQITGVEGYVESAASGLLNGISAACEIKNKEFPVFGRATAIGALAEYVSDKTVGNFQPMNINFGIMLPLEYRVKGKRNKNLAISQRSLERIDEIMREASL